MKSYDLKYKDLEEGEVYTAITDNGLELSKMTIKNGLPCDPKTGRYIRLSVEELASAKYRKEHNLPLLSTTDYNILKMLHITCTHIKKDETNQVVVYGLSHLRKDVTGLFGGNLDSIPNNGKKYDIDDLLEFYKL